MKRLEDGLRARLGLQCDDGACPRAADGVSSGVCGPNRRMGSIGRPWEQSVDEDGGSSCRQNEYSLAVCQGSWTGVGMV